MTHFSSLTMWQYSIEPRTRKYVREYGFLSFERKYKKTIIGYIIGSFKTASKKAVSKAGQLRQTMIKLSQTMMKLWNLMKI